MAGTQKQAAGAFALKPDARRAGRAAALILSPHLVLGTWLLVVPDHRAFLTSQIVTLLHTGLALITIPIVAFWVFGHARKMRAPAVRDTGFAFVIRWTLVAAALVAMTTGLIVVWGGDITETGKVHALCGVIVGVPLSIHLWLAARRWWAAGVLLLLAAATSGSILAKKLLPPEPLEARVPEFEYKVRPTALYEPATWCAECHEQDYDEWKRSTHAKTLSNPPVREGFDRLNKMAGFDLAEVGRIIGGARPPNADQAIFACEACHAPASFYGDDPTDIRKATGVTGEGVGCSFCHTLRDVRVHEVDSAKVEVRLQGTADYLKFLPQVPSFVSAPETVRRYIGQGSKNKLVRKIADYLIRWRPAVHSHDYHSPVLDTSRSCLACHGMGSLDEGPDVPHKTYISWKQSPYNTGDPKTTTTCQDCHMAHRMTGGPVRESYKMVPWGPERQPGRSHLLLGGNVNSALLLGEPEYAELEHKFNTQAASISIVDAKPAGDHLDVSVSVKSEMVGHYMPSMETHDRYWWVEVSAVDASGKVIASTPRPKSEEDFESPSPVLFRCTEVPKPECDTLLRPKESRVYTARLELPKDAHPERLDAELHLSIDRRPTATASKPYSITTAGTAH